jgi:hypothetical protein
VTGGKKAADEPSSPPPILKTWPRLYAAVLGMLVLEVILFTILTRSFQ